MSLGSIWTCSTCSKTIQNEEPNWLGQCESCSALCRLVPYGWTQVDTSFRRQRPAHVHPRVWVLDPANGLLKIRPEPEQGADRNPLNYPESCWEWQPGQHHAPQASPALFESPMAPEMNWAVVGKRARQVPAYYLFLPAPPKTMLEPEADHLCCNRRCVNPGHIEWVTKSENTRRNAIRERYSVRWMAKFTAAAKEAGVL